MSFTPEQEEFEAKWHNKWVRAKGEVYKIPPKEYYVTSALYKWEKDHKYDIEDVTILAIMSREHNPPDVIEWFTIKIAPEDLDKALADFEILDPPP